MAGRHGSVYWLTCFWFVILVCAVAVAVLKPAAAVQPAWPAETIESFSPVYVYNIPTLEFQRNVSACHPSMSVYLNLAREEEIQKLCQTHAHTLRIVSGGFQGR